MRSTVVRARGGRYTADRVDSRPLTHDPVPPEATVSLIVSPNLTIDRTVRIDRLEPGTVMRPEAAVVTAGAKGVNVARVLHALGARPRLVGFVPRDDALQVAALFGVEPFELLGVEVDGAIRVATIYLEADGRTTVLNEPGPQITAADAQRLIERVDDALGARAVPGLAASGSLPPGAPVSTYAALVKVARRRGVEVVVDAARDVLAATLDVEPDLVTPNLAEAEAALGAASAEAVDELGADVPARAIDAAQALVAAGARAAVVTAGAAGAALAEPGSSRWFDAVAVAVVNPIGAGDSFVGGYLDARSRGAPRDRAVLRGMAAASASCEQQLAGGVDPARVEELAGRLHVAQDGGGG